MNKLIPAVLGLVAASVLATAPVYAAQKAADMTCKEFLALDKEFQPHAVYWIEGFSKGGKAEDVDFNLEMFKRPVVNVVEECNKNPQAKVHESLEGWQHEE